MSGRIVVWVIDTDDDAASPEQAALTAFRHVRREGTAATVFNVLDARASAVLTALLATQSTQVDLQDVFADRMEQLYNQEIIHV